MKTIVLPVHSVCAGGRDEGGGLGQRQQIGELLAVVRLVEEIDQGLGDHRPDAFDRRQFRLGALAGRRGLQRLDRPEAAHQILGGDRSDMADAKPEQEARRIEPDPRVDRGEQIIDRLLLPPLAADQLAAMILQPEDIRGRVEPAQLDELDDRSFRPAHRCPSPRATRNASAARSAGPGRSGRRCSGRRPRPPRRPLRTGTSGNGRGRHRARRGSSRVKFSTTCGMTSPARWIRTRSPTRRPSRAISSRLWSVTLATITPPTPTGFSRPTGVSLPVRPTWMSIASSVVSAFSAGNLCARPQRGARADLAEPFLPVEAADLIDHPVDVVRQLGACPLDRRIMGRALRRPSHSA